MKRRPYRIQRGKNFPPLYWMMIPPTNVPRKARASPQGTDQRRISIPDPPPSPVLLTALQVIELLFCKLLKGQQATTHQIQPLLTSYATSFHLLLPVSTSKQGKETLELSRDCALPESWRERHHYRCLLEKSNNPPM